MNHPLDAQRRAIVRTGVLKWGRLMGSKRIFDSRRPVVGWGLGLLCVFSVCTAWGTSPRFAADVQALTKDAHRLTGTEECRAAFDVVSHRLSTLAPDLVFTQEFPVVQMRVKRCEAQLADGRTVALLPMQPNGIIPPITPREGLSGPLFDAGDGALDHFLDRSVEGSIVVIDYNAGTDWLRSFRLGARAVIFVGSGQSEAWHSHIVDANVNLPRFFYDGPRSDLRHGAIAVLHSEIVWEPGIGRNLFALYNGSSPVFSQEQEEVIVLAAPLDSYGEIPLLSPGARGAASIAGLLKLAGHFSTERPRRHMLLAFLDAQAQGHLGAARFYRALETANPTASLSARQASLDREQTILDDMLSLASSDQPLGQASISRRQLVNRLKYRATERSYEVADRMLERRIECQRIEREEEGPDAEARAAALRREIEEDLRREKDEWNDVRRALGKDRADDVSPTIRARLDSLMVDILKDIRKRRDEMVRERRALEDDTRIRDILNGKWISLHAALLLGDTTPRWGVVVGCNNSRGNSEFHNMHDNHGLYGKVQAVFLKAYDELAAQGDSLALFERASVDKSLAQTRILWAAPYLIHSGEIAGLFGIYNIALATCQEALVREGTPDDTIDLLNLERIEAQVDGIAGMLMAVANHEGLSLRRGIISDAEYSMPQFSGETVSGPTVMGVLPGSSIPNMPVGGAVVQFVPWERGLLGFGTQKPYAFQNFRTCLSSANGTYEIGPIRGAWAWLAGRGFAAVFDERGKALFVSDDNSAGNVRSRLNVFRCNPGWIVLPPPLKIRSDGVGALTLLSARDNGALDRQKSFLQLGDGVAGWYAAEREEGVKLFNLRLDVSLNSGPGMTTNNVTGMTPLGTGFPMGGSWESIPTSRRSALDLWRLNDSRIMLLQSKNIIDSSLAELHGRAEDMLLETSGGPVTLRSEAIEASSFMASQPVYTQTRKTVDDIVFAVLLLLGLSVPFAFAVERVAIGSTTIYKQVSACGVIFVATFVLLFLTHPAFAIANTPVIIFLGFAILTLSMLVISIIMRRFETELKVLQGMPATVHSTDVSRMGTLMAAMLMGMSTMRRRPLRTALTAVTIILLTFTILSFASFGTQSGVIRLFAAPVPPYHGVFVHDVKWIELGADIMDVVRGRWAADGKICVRRWISPDTESAVGLLLSRTDGTRPLPIKGVLGIDPAEIRRRPDLRSVLDESLEGKILLTSSVARALGVSEGDDVLLAGVRLQVGRLTDPVALSVATDMDGSSILPVDFTEKRSSSRGDESLEASVQTTMTWTSLPVDSVVVVPEGVAARLGGRLRAWAVYTDNSAQAAKLAEDMARMLPMPVAGTLRNGVFRHILGTVVAASGASDLLFPILLGGLVIFGTMLGSVADREREIYTFSALGLAPRHVATLFVSEAVVYSLMGGMGGYLLAQAVVKIMNALASYGLARAPEVNMSSTNTIVTILIVMGTVLVSAIYPAIKAAKSANPGLMRTWRPPAPAGNVMDMVFPFTVSEYDITGVVSFLKEHFDNHSDVGLGLLMARNTEILREEDGVLGVRSLLTLAPFDLGVSQHFAMRSTPSEIPGIDEVRIRIERVSGQPKDWQRLNRMLLDDLRQQFLIWRSLPEGTMDVYRQRTLTTLGNRDEVA